MVLYSLLSFMLRIFIFIFLVSSSFCSWGVSQVQAISTPMSVFRELGVELSDPIADTYYA